MTTRRFALLATTALLASACSANSADPTEPSKPTSGGSGLSGQPIGLVRFNGCDEVLDYIKTEALERVGPWGLDGDRDLVIMEDGAEMTDASVANQPPATAAADSSTGDIDEGLTSETGTNVQEAGVDEPDIIKTDGTRIVTLSNGPNGSVLAVSDISDRAPTETGKLKFASYANDMMLSGDRVLVLSTGGDVLRMPVDTGDAEQSLATDAILPQWSSQTVITEISIAGKPTVVNTVAINGQYLSGRSVGNRLRVAVSSPPASLPWVSPQSEAGEKRAEESNREIIEESTLADWLPEISVAGGQPSQLLDCDSIHRPATFAGFDTVSILDFDLDSGLKATTDAVGVLGAGQTVYSSLDRFYIASTESNWTTVPMFDDTDADSDISLAIEDSTTDVHAFAISQTEPTTYVASGEVPGSLLNQFSLDSADGNLRVVTTSTSPEGETETFLRVLAEEGDQLKEIGSVGGLGKGERLYSARLFDKIGFAVTFQQIDPLYVLDLADPTNPRVSGELKIPGYSTYLHPIGDGRLLGVGAAATDEGRRTGLKVSLFDVSDVENPTEITNWTLDEASSEAEYDAHAFHYSDGLLVLPIAPNYWENPEPPGAVVLRIDDTITEVGRLEITQENGAEPTSDCREIEQRSLFEEGVVFGEPSESRHLQVCGPDQTGGWGDWNCESLSYEQLATYATDEKLFESDTAKIGLSEGDRLEVCYPLEHWEDQVRRIITVDDTFYMLTNRDLRANDRTTLEELGAVRVV